MSRGSVILRFREVPKLTCNSPCCVRLIWSHAKIYVGQVKVDNVYVRL